MFLFTDKDLVDVLPLREKSFKECGINTDNLEVICLKEGTFAFLEVEDLEKYNKFKLNDITVQSQEERERMLSELKIKLEKELEESRKSTPEYKLSVLEEKIESMRASHSDLLLELDFRVMDLEDNTGVEPVHLLNLLKQAGMNSTYMVILDKIETGNYRNREEIVSICDRYLSRNRIDQDEYDRLMDVLEKKEADKAEVVE